MTLDTVQALKFDRLKFAPGKLSTYLELRVDLSDHAEVESIQDFGSVYGDHTCTAHSLQKNLRFHPSRHLIANRDNGTVLQKSLQNTVMNSK